jgi:hypothetical protein
VWDKENKVNIPFKLFPHQSRTLKAYRESDEVVILKYRQGGITTTTCGYLAHLINFTPNVKIAVVADKLQLARDSIFATIVGMISSLPDFLRNEPEEKNTQTFKKYMNNAVLQAFAAGKEGVRGFSPDVLFVDEAAFLEHGPEFQTAAIGTMSAGGQVILNSTPKGMDPVYYATIDAAKNKRNNYTVVEIYWYEDPRFNRDLKWIKGGVTIEERNPDKFKQLVTEGWKPTSSWFEMMSAKFNHDPKKIAQELECSFIGSGGNLLNDTVISRIEKQTVKDPIWTNINGDGNFWVWEDPMAGENYLMCVDVSGGGEDYHTINIFKECEGGLDQVAEYQGKVPPEDLGNMCVYWGKKYNSAYIVMDVTGGYGAVPMNTILETGYKNIHYSEIRNSAVKERLFNFSKEINGKEVLPGFTIGANRSLLLQEFERMCRMEELLIRSSRMVSEFKTFVWDEGKGRFDHLRSAHDDLLMGSAMGIYGFMGKGKVRDEKERIGAMLNSWVTMQGDAPDSPDSGFNQGNTNHGYIFNNGLDNLWML